MFNLWDRVTVKPIVTDVNCEGRPYAGATGTVIAAYRGNKVDVEIEARRQFLIEFDDITLCGLGLSSSWFSSQPCNHNFVSFSTNYHRGQSNSIFIYGQYGKGKNQRFFAVYSLGLLEPYIRQDTLKNNDGRLNCYWCNVPTVKRGGGQYDLCPKCNK